MVLHANNSDGSQARQQVERACDEFVSLYRVPTISAIYMMRNASLHLAFDLSGHFPGNRMVRSESLNP